MNMIQTFRIMEGIDDLEAIKWVLHNWIQDKPVAKEWKSWSKQAGWTSFADA